MAYGSSMSSPNKMSMRMAKEKNKPIEMKPLKGLTMSQTKKLMEHSKMHKGGMNSKHMKNMVKFMRAGDTFAKAHKKAMELDKKK
tara:strand:- start:1647 stop:1901 length:255 start_codon:yes stop_codon:yes gene_type:complete